MMMMMLIKPAILTLRSVSSKRKFLHFVSSSTFSIVSLRALQSLQSIYQDNYVLNQICRPKSSESLNETADSVHKNFTSIVSSLLTNT